MVEIEYIKTKSKYVFLVKSHWEDEDERMYEIISDEQKTKEYLK